MEDTNLFHRSPAPLILIAILSVLLLSSLGGAVLCLCPARCSSRHRRRRPAAAAASATITITGAPRTPDLERNLSHRSQSSGVGSICARPPTPAAGYAADDDYGMAVEMSDWAVSFPSFPGVERRRATPLPPPRRKHVRFARCVRPGSGAAGGDSPGGSSITPPPPPPPPPGCCHSQNAHSSPEGVVGLAVTTGCANIELPPHREEGQQQQQHQHAADTGHAPDSGHWCAVQPRWPLLGLGEILIIRRPPAANDTDREGEDGHPQDPAPGAASVAAAMSSDESSGELTPTSSLGRGGGGASPSPQQAHRSTAPSSSPRQDALAVTDWEESSAGGLTPTSSEAGSHFGLEPQGKTRTPAGRALSLDSMMVVVGSGRDGRPRRLTWSGCLRQRRTGPAV